VDRNFGPGEYSNGWRFEVAADRGGVALGLLVFIVWWTMKR
jgi:hypothetical protein